MYHVYGYDLKSGEDCLLNSFTYKQEAIRWAKGYTSRDMGGWDKVCVQCEREVDVDETMEVVVWSVYEEPIGEY